MIEKCRLKNVVILIQTILGFVLSRKIINIYNDIASKYVSIVIEFLIKIHPNMLLNGILGDWYY